MADDAFSDNVNEIASRLLLTAEPLYREFSQEEVLVAIASCLGQSLAGRSLSPRAVSSVAEIVADGLRHVASDLSEAMRLLDEAAEQQRGSR
jgi:hypothetical protein